MPHSPGPPGGHRAGGRGAARAGAPLKTRVQSWASPPATRGWPARCGQRPRRTGPWGRRRSACRRRTGSRTGPTGPRWGAGGNGGETRGRCSHGHPGGRGACQTRSPHLPTRRSGLPGATPLWGRLLRLTSLWTPTDTAIPGPRSACPFHCDPTGRSGSREAPCDLSKGVSFSREAPADPLLIPVESSRQGGVSRLRWRNRRVALTTELPDGRAQAWSWGSPTALPPTAPPTTEESPAL